jgi:hypothetical protein
MAYSKGYAAIAFSNTEISMRISNVQFTGWIVPGMHFRPGTS